MLATILLSCTFYNGYALVFTNITADLTCSCKDPHLVLAYGGGADFRGEDNTYYNYLSSPRTSVNVKLRSSIFPLKQATINGTFVVEVGLTVQLRSSRCNVSASAEVIQKNNYAWNFIQGQCGSRRFLLGRLIV